MFILYVFQPPKSTLLFPGSGAVISVPRSSLLLRVSTLLFALCPRGQGELISCRNPLSMQWICMKQCFTFLIKSLHRTESGKKGWCIKYRRTFLFFFHSFRLTYESNINHRVSGGAARRPAANTPYTTYQWAVRSSARFYCIQSFFSHFPFGWNYVWVDHIYMHIFI